MKIITNVNGVDTVYVQSIDMKKINELSLMGASYNIPASIWGHTYLDNADIMNNPTKKRDYIKFTEHHELDFFEQRELAFILSHDYLSNLSLDQIKDKIDSCKRRIEELKKHAAKEYQIMQIEYMIETLEYTLNLKENGQELPVPDEIDVHKPEATGFQKFINRFTQK